MNGPVDAPVIRTPDQHLRVFVSSTLRELEPERRAARGAIERLRLAPVMFEFGARPRPPRELYRAYLEQSDVFVGVYWQQYGWGAPGESVSGLEDEYLLAPPALDRVEETERRAIQLVGEQGRPMFAVMLGDVERAGALLGAAETARTRTGLIDQRSYITYRPFVEQVLASERAAVFEAGRVRGRAMSRRSALDLVLENRPEP